MINKVEIKNLAKKYGFKCKILNNIVLIESKYDSWYVECREYDKFPLVLYHQNRRYDKNKYHKQRKFKDFQFLFKSIHEHDKNSIKKANCWYNDHLDYLFSQISVHKTNQIKKNSIMC